MVSQEFLNLVDGKSTPAASDKTLPISDPATGVVWATMPDSSEEDAHRAVAAASDAFDQWARMPGMPRTAILRQVGRALADNIEELSSLESRDSGRLLHLDRTGDMPGAAFVWDEAASQVRSAPVGSSLQVDDRTFAFTRREPLGVVVGIEN